MPPHPPHSTAPAGWYDDGSGRGQYWDGSRWSEPFVDQPLALSDGVPAPSVVSRVFSESLAAREPQAS